MTGIICPYTNENGYCDSTACHNMNVVGNIIPKERPENISNSSIWVKPQSNWHTGTPTEEGWYLCWVKFEKGNENAIVYYWDNHEWSIVPRFYLASNDIILAWQKIEPYKED